jgi:hypothetical protein
LPRCGRDAHGIHDKLREQASEVRSTTSRSTANPTT